MSEYTHPQLKLSSLSLGESELSSKEIVVLVGSVGADEDVFEVVHLL